MSRDILLGVVVGPQGLHGEVKVKTFTARPESLGAYGPLRTKDGRRLNVVDARATRADIALVRFKGIKDRSAAEKLKGIELFVPREALPQPDEDEFYHADLLGLTAQDAEGRVLGKVSGVHNFGAGDIIVIVRPGGDEMFLPFTREIVPDIDVKSGRIVVAAPPETDEPEDRA